MGSRVLMEQVLSHFPQRNLRYVFAYGSAVFQQHGNSPIGTNMLDFVFAVDEPKEWHKENMKRNWKHYSSLKYLGSNYVSKIQNNFGARVYYNTLVQCENRLIKYGVISLINDLLDWETLYVSGRLHKPVEVLVEEASTTDLGQAIATNLQSAVHTALLLLPEEFTEEALFQTIAGLSYMGDFRMTIGENKNKVQNIVAPNVQRFRKLYEQILTNEEHLHWNRPDGFLEQSCSPISVYHHLNLLPKCLSASCSQLSINATLTDVTATLKKCFAAWHMTTSAAM